MGTWGSDAAYSLLTHYRPRGQAFGPRKEAYFQLFLRERWAFWHAAAVWHSRRRNVPMHWISERHEFRLRAASKLVSRKIIRQHALDDPFLAEQFWRVKLMPRVARHVHKREHNFKPGHRYYGRKS